MACGGVTTLVGRSPQRPVFCLNDLGRIRSHRPCPTEGCKRLDQRPGRRRESDNVSVTGAAVVIGDPEVAIAGQQQSIRATTTVAIRIERKELKIAPVSTNLEESFAAFSVNVVQAIKVSVRSENQPAPDGRQAVGRREIQRNRLERSRSSSEMQQLLALWSRVEPVE